MMSLLDDLKYKAAIEQIHSAIQLHQDQKYWSSITLAGAGEEILGKLCEKNNKETALKILINTSIVILKDRTRYKTIRDHILFYRNEAKHYDRNDIPNINKLSSESKDIINRAIDNHWKYKEIITDEMEQFDKVPTPLRSS